MQLLVLLVQYSVGAVSGDVCFEKRGGKPQAMILFLLTQ